MARGTIATVKRNSCINCKHRKVRCDLKTPCSICLRRKDTCVYPATDNRTVRRSVNSIKRLESRLAQLEDTLLQIRNIPSVDIEIIKILDKTAVAGNANDKDNFYDSRVNQFNILTIPENDNSGSAILGPISVYKKYDSSEGTPKMQLALKDSTTEAFHDNMFEEDGITFYKFVPCTKALFDEDLYDSIGSFFKWQYQSNYLFIHRESFLYHFLLLDFDNDFVSEELIYSIAAVGARFSSNHRLRIQADSYYNHARKSIFISPDTLEIDFSKATLTKLQSLLCLAFFDISKGSLTTGWILSGIAFRIGSNIGFERDPSEWIYGQRTSLNIRPGYPFDLKAVQRRIYWGTYIADHFISMIFGRYPSLKRMESSIMPSSDLYNLPEITNFLYYDVRLETHYTCDILITLQTLVKLARISESMILDVFSSITNTKAGTPQRDMAIKERLEKLEMYNDLLDKWTLELPETLNLDEESLLNSGHNYLFLSIRSSYFLTRLSLNRPFVQYTDNVAPNKSVEVCEVVLIDLFLVLKSMDDVSSSQQFEPTLPMVYSLVLGTSIITLKMSFGYDSIGKFEIRNILDLFLKYLEISSGSVEIAKTAISVAHTTTEDMKESHPLKFPPESTLEDTFLDKLFNGDIIDSVLDPEFFMLDSIEGTY